MYNVLYIYLDIKITVCCPLQDISGDGSVYWAGSAVGPGQSSGQNNDGVSPGDFLSGSNQHIFTHLKYIGRPVSVSSVSAVEWLIPG